MLWHMHLNFQLFCSLYSVVVSIHSLLYYILFLFFILVVYYSIAVYLKKSRTNALASKRFTTSFVVPFSERTFSLPYITLFFRFWSLPPQLSLIPTNSHVNLCRENSIWLVFMAASKSNHKLPFLSSIVQPTTLLLLKIELDFSSSLSVSSTDECNCRKIFFHLSSYTILELYVW